MKITVLTGAGISKESGLDTFRTDTGLWEQHKIEDVATYEAFTRDPNKVQNFYNLRRRQVLGVEPNQAHILLASLEERHDVTIITQNIDDLHERAGSTNVIHIHGEIFKVKGDGPVAKTYKWLGDLRQGDLCFISHEQLRPDIVWFGEMPYRFDEAEESATNCDLFVVVGTSAQVYPAAGLIDLCPLPKVYVVDPEPPRFGFRYENIAEVASIGVKTLIERAEL